MAPDYTCLDRKEKRKSRGLAEKSAVPGQRSAIQIATALASETGWARLL